MKVKTKNVTFDYLLKLGARKRKKPPRPSFLFRTLVRILSIGELSKVNFTYEKIGMKRLPKGPCLFLMNHSSFLDLKIASKILYPRSYNIIATSDAMLGKEWLMRRLGIVATNKFTPDVPLALDVIKILKKKNRSVLLYPEAGYSFDGTKTTLPKSLAQLVKKLCVPVVTIITDGAYLYDPLYNQLQKRKVTVSAKVKLLLTPEKAKNSSLEEIESLINEDFSFDNFKSQLDNNVLITEKFRADGLHRVLYRCPSCGAEGRTVGKGETLTCEACKKVYRLEENGQMKALSGETEFAHIPDWFSYQRECVKNEILSKNYSFSARVKIGAIYDYKQLYVLGEGTLTHTLTGFTLISDDGEINHTQHPLYQYSLNSDFYWYEGEDIISLGNNDILFYCFFDKSVPVAKLRLATEELYKLYKGKQI
jgi:1-acyl-sn-glycerol-3-phosphate acyltransferase/rubredoxin